MIQENLLKKALTSNRVVFGTWSVLHSVSSIEALGATPLDFILFDREHDSISYEKIAQYTSFCFASRLTPLVRIPEISLSEVQRALDSGAQGLHVPNISRPEQIEKLLELALFPPLGKRGFAPFTKACGYQKEKVSYVLQNTNNQLLLAVHIENKEGIENLSKLLSYEFIDIFFVGLFDLANSLGLQGDIRHPHWEEILKSLIKQIQSKNKIAGTIAMNLEQAEYLLGLGFQYLTISSDCDMLFSSYTNFLQNVGRVSYGVKS